jgi:hypothetical protein
MARPNIWFEAFGPADPLHDPDYSAKMGLHSIAGDNDLDDLAELLTSNGELGALLGEHGWKLERRDEGNNMPGYANWPDWARYHSYVDPHEYEMGVQEKYYRKEEFHALVRKMVNAYAKQKPEAAAQVNAVLSLCS